MFPRLQKQILPNGCKEMERCPRRGSSWDRQPGGGVHDGEARIRRFGVFELFPGPALEQAGQIGPSGRGQRMFRAHNLFPHEECGPEKLLGLLEITTGEGQTGHLVEDFRDELVIVPDVLFLYDKSFPQCFLRLNESTALLLHPGDGGQSMSDLVVHRAINRFPDLEDLPQTLLRSPHVPTGE